MKVFVAGHKGYIGAHLVDLLRQAGHTVTGCDLGLFDGCAGEEVVPPARDLHIGVGDVTLKDVAGHDCIMHLAAISNDPIGEVDALETYAVNRDASIRIVQLAETAGAQRYLFAASCSVYGAGKKLDLDETDALNPLTAYAKSKIATEQAVSALADCDFAPVYLRNATAYGIPRCCALTLLSITFSPARCPPARYVSCRTVRLGARHCPSLHRLHDAPKERIHNKIVNAGGNHENYQVRDMGDKVKGLIPSATITYTGEIGAGPRNCRVKFDLLHKVLPDFSLQYNLSIGMEELYRKLINHGFSEEDLIGDQFVRLRALKKRLDGLRTSRESSLLRSGLLQ